MAIAGPPTPLPFFQLRKGPSFWQREPKIVPASPNVATHFTEFYCNSAGSNLNAGSTCADTGGSNSAIYTSTNGSWSTSTNIFTPTDGTNPVASGVAPGQFISIYNDGASVAVYIARITAVTNAANGPITVSSTVIYGAAPTTSATGRSVKVGGSWLGPNGASIFPFGLIGNIANLVNPASDMVRVNVKNDQTYSLSVALVVSSLSAGTPSAVMQGYSSVPGDGGRATFTSSVTGSSAATHLGNGSAFIDLIFEATSSTGLLTVGAFTCSGSNNLFFRCVFRGGQQFGIQSIGTGTRLVECEAYGNNISNNSATASGGFHITNTLGTSIINCYSHDNKCTGLFTQGITFVVNSIFESNVGAGVCFSMANTANTFDCFGCTFYNNQGPAILNNNAGTGKLFALIQNNIFENNGAGVVVTTAGNGGILYNNGRFGNRGPDMLRSVFDTGTDIAFSTSPFQSPDTGDFSLVLAEAIGVGRGSFTQLGSGKSGTLSFPDIGAAQAQNTTQSFTTTGIQTLPYGYVGYIYGWKWNFNQATTVTVQSGSLPPGLNLVAASPYTINIIGTPTTVGIYDFVLRATVGSSTGDANFEITVVDDPDEGIGGLLGGLRPLS